MISSSLGEFCVRSSLAKKVALCIFFSQMAARPRDNVYVRIGRTHKTGLCICITVGKVQNEVSKSLRTAVSNVVKGRRPEGEVRDVVRCNEVKIGCRVRDSTHDAEVLVMYGHSRVERNNVNGN